MFKCLKNRKGFTLIELMMVIAVIGILAAVLIPKLGGIKDNAKLSGVDANARQVQAHVTGLIERYKNHPDDFRDALISAIDSTDDKIVNPFDSNSVGAGEVDDSDKAVYVGVGLGSSVKGAIYVEIEKNDDGDKIDYVTITPIDNDGSEMPEIEIKP